MKPKALDTKQPKLLPLPVEALKRSTNPRRFSFSTTAELEPLTEFPGQSRAVDSVRFGLGIRHEGYNLFVLGPSGTGKRAVVRHFTHEQAQSGAKPSDWAYVHNFSEPHKPKMLRLPPGRGGALKQEMERLIEELRAAIPAAFESEDYRTRRQVIDQQYKEKQEEAFDKVSQRAAEKGVVIMRTPLGVGLAIAKDGQALSSEEFQQLPPKEREHLQAEMDAIHQLLEAVFRQVPKWESEQRQKIRDLNRETTRFAIGHLISGIRERYQDLSNVLEHLEVVEQDLVENAGRFLVHSQTEQPENPLEQALGRAFSDSRPFDRYQVNLLVDHAATQGAPVVEEEYPTLQNLIGRVEYRAQLGNLVTDFSLIRPGALHRANGGYLVLDARRVLQQPYVWEELKRVLSAKEIQIRGVGEMLGLTSTTTLQPEAIPLQVKLVLLGNRLLYYLLCEFDPDFRELFKVAADFEDRMDRDESSELVYARLIASMAQREGLKPLDAEAVAKVIDHSSRLAKDAGKMTTQLESVADVLREADYWAASEGRDVTSAKDVEHATCQQVYRVSRLFEHVQEEIEHGTLLVDTSGSKVGQVNGLSVMDLGGFTFGHPSRITARVRLGEGEVVDIEREVEMGGPLHSKGVLILAGYLGGRFARERPLSLSVSLVFEQTYAGVEGDSASMAELAAILSALAKVPIKQGVAVTGSVNQLGEAQAVGGVNEKIEGFFEVCKRAGLTGEQGVIIPATNVRHLMLKDEVLDRVREGKFHVWAVSHVDQAMGILTGLEAGERDQAGRFPAESLNHLVEAELALLAETARSFLSERREA